MAKVQVPAHWVGQNYLPAICARHGGPATSFRKANFHTKTPLWTYLLIPLGLLIFAIVTRDPHDRPQSPADVSPVFR